MIDRASWQAAFRAGDAPAVVKALCAAWRELLSISPETFRPAETEPHLTELLCEFLRATKANTKLTGQWSYEGRQANLKRMTDKGLGVVKRKRTDIQYFSNREDPPLDLVFEFKKLSHLKSQRDQYVEDGLLRFVTGEYSVGQPVALMVGILITHRDDAVPPLLRWLDSPDAKELLYLETIDGRQLRAPSRLFPAEGEFDTEHLRPVEKGPAHGTIIVSHLFVEFPNLPRAAAKRARRNHLLAELR